jgi:tRNA (cmo5U34)-methyltransferase
MAKDALKINPDIVGNENRDRIFDKAGEPVYDFKFDNKTAKVFDDMVGRSVPFYDEIQRMVCELSADFAQDGTNIYDMGCSTGTTFLQLDPLVSEKVNFIGIDNSADMLQQAETKLKDVSAKRSVELRLSDIQSGLSIENASVVTMVLTLQFVRPLHRDRLIQKIYDGLNPNGALILVEKLTTSHTMLNRLFIDHYYDHKRRVGYSEIEITRKREALENVLIPYRMEENVSMLQEAGFRHVEDFFRWYNFCAIVAVK